MVHVVKPLLTDDYYADAGRQQTVIEELEGYGFVTETRRHTFGLFSPANAQNLCDIIELKELETPLYKKRELTLMGLAETLDGAKELVAGAVIAADGEVSVLRALFREQSGKGAGG